MMYFAIDSSSLLTLDSKVFIKNKLRKVFPTSIIVNNYLKVLENISDLDISIGMFVNGTKRLNVKNIARKHKIGIFGMFIPDIMTSKKDISKKSCSAINVALDQLLPEIKQEILVWNYCRRDKKYNLNKLKIIRFENFWFYISLMDNFKNIGRYIATVDIPNDDVEKFLCQFCRVRKLLSSSVDLYLSLDISKLEDPKEIYHEIEKICPGSVKVLIMDWDDQKISIDKKIFLCRNINKNTDEPLIVFKFNPSNFKNFLKNIRENIELVIAK